MDILTVGVLKQILDKVPEDYTVEFKNKTTIMPIDDKFEIDIGGKRILFKSM